MLTTQQQQQQNQQPQLSKQIKHKNKMQTPFTDNNNDRISKGVVLQTVADFVVTLVLAAAAAAVVVPRVLCVISRVLFNN